MPDPAPTADQLLVQTLAHCTPKPVRWLWQDRLPLGKVTLLCGDPGLGKSFLTLDLAARLSRGDGWPTDDHAATHHLTADAQQHALAQLQAEDPANFERLCRDLEQHENPERTTAAANLLDELVRTRFAAAHPAADTASTVPATTLLLACEDDADDTIAPACSPPAPTSTTSTCSTRSTTSPADATPDCSRSKTPTTSTASNTSSNNTSPRPTPSAC